MVQDSISDQTAFYASRGFGRTIGFGQRPALVVIDLTLGFTDPARPFGSELSSQIQATAGLLEVARARSVPVLFTSVRYESPDLADAGVWALKQGGAASLAAARDGHALDPRLQACDSDVLIYKKFASAFFGTDLLTRLVSLKVDTVILTGTSTSGCVRATAVDASQYGFRPMVVREAVGDRSQPAHAQSLIDLHAKYADVVSFDATLDYLQSMPTTDSNQWTTSATD